MGHGSQGTNRFVPATRVAAPCLTERPRKGRKTEPSMYGGSSSSGDSAGQPLDRGPSLLVAPCRGENNRKTRKGWGEIIASQQRVCCADRKAETVAAAAPAT